MQATIHGFYLRDKRLPSSTNVQNRSHSNSLLKHPLICNKRDMFSDIPMEPQAAPSHAPFASGHHQAFPANTCPSGGKALHSMGRQTITSKVYPAKSVDEFNGRCNGPKRQDGPKDPRKHHLIPSREDLYVPKIHPPSIMNLNFASTSFVLRDKHSPSIMRSLKI